MRSPHLRFGSHGKVSRPAAPLRIGVLASGRGSNFRAIVEAVEAGRIPAVVAVLVSDRPGAPVLDIARAHRIETVVVTPAEHPTREAFDKALIAALDAREVGLVCLAGFMRILGATFVAHYTGRLLNVHPSLLPAFPGLRPHRQALQHGVKVSGATVHFVDEGVDTGPIALQAAVPVDAGDTEETLAARILAEEHRIYPEAVRLFAQGRLRVEGGRVVVDAGQP
jgi:phosphoribosylglycinamide formyltransferase-1